LEFVPKIPLLLPRSDWFIHGNNQMNQAKEGDEEKAQGRERTCSCVLTGTKRGRILENKGCSIVAQDNESPAIIPVGVGGKMAVVRCSFIFIENKIAFNVIYNRYYNSRRYVLPRLKSSSDFSVLQIQVKGTAFCLQLFQSYLRAYTTLGGTFSSLSW
jgi:hypothetical protein